MISERKGHKKLGHSFKMKKSSNRIKLVLWKVFFLKTSSFYYEMAKPTTALLTIIWKCLFYLVQRRLEAEDAEVYSVPRFYPGTQDVFS
jgi:hypothetical protein